MDDYSSDQGREATAVDDLATFMDGAESLLNELSGVFDDFNPPNPLKPSADVLTDTAAVNGADTGAGIAADIAADTPEEIQVTSPPRIEPPAMIWKPARRARFRFRR
jgi:hypothetical protein